MSHDTALPAADISSTPANRRLVRRTGWVVSALLLALLAGAGLRVYASSKQSRSLADTTARQALRSVTVGLAAPDEGRRTLALPGTLRGANEAAIYARTTGYLKRWTKDIGDTVKQGELLAVIDAPETEQELLQARALRSQVLARQGLAESSLARWQGLRARDAVSQQELDERAAAVRQAQADLAAANANIRRLEELRSFQRVVAPFDGVVVRRNAEVGMLVGAGTSGNARELFHLAQLDPLRVSVAVPQTYAADVRIGQEVSLRLIERPGAPLRGKVARTAGAVDPDSRAMNVEIELANPGGKLLAGAYVEAGFSARSGPGRLLVPSSALQFRQDGPRLAVVDGDSRIALRNVKLGRDLGRNVEVLAGLDANDRFVLNPADSLEAGENVIAVAAAPKATASGAAPARAASAAGARS